MATNEQKTTATHHREDTPLELVRRSVKRNPDACAFLTLHEDGTESSMSYSGLWQAIGRGSNLLRALGRGMGDGIAISSGSSALATAAMYAAQAVGNVLVMDPGTGDALEESVSALSRKLAVKAAIVSGAYPSEHG